MKKQLIAAIAVALALGASAQMADVTTPQKVFVGQPDPMCNPVLSPDGSTVIVTNADFTNARIATFADARVRPYEAPRRALFDMNYSGPEVDGVSVATAGSVLTITRNGVSREYTPVPSQAGYTWASVSPDGTKVLFFAAGRGIVVTDLEGRVLAEAGNYEAPVWYGNDHILAQNAKDDGHQYISSQIVLLSADGSQMQELTAPESFAMTPSGAFDVNTVVYSTIDGILYKMNVTLR
ncbi:MAG: hypothetical protein J6C67_00750 [Muribaculaceae bacterium]|nr:hypothetical protein [Muribaculaceae bacterium]